MSVIVELALFPTDKGTSVSPYVARAVRIVRDSGLAFELGPMGTCIEGEWDAVMAVVSRCFKALAADSERVYLTLKADYRKGPVGRLQGKVRAVEAKLAGPEAAFEDPPAL
jgi:uncharacterized protein (TIGR00106 family)